MRSVIRQLLAFIGLIVSLLGSCFSLLFVMGYGLVIMVSPWFFNLKTLDLSEMLVIVLAGVALLVFGALLTALGLRLTKFCLASYADAAVAPLAPPYSGCSARSRPGSRLRI